MTDNPHPRYSPAWHDFRIERVRQLCERHRDEQPTYQQSLRERAAVLIERYQEKKPRKRRFWWR